MTTPQLQNPFVGLRSYQSADSLYYFGRNEQTKTLLRLLHQHRFVAVVGSSGAGKSSLIRAGLIPQLEAGFLVQDRDQWLVASTKPGDAPLSNLVNSLLDALKTNSTSDIAANERQQLVDEINENGTQALLTHLTPLLSGSDTNLFILIDQFEELFRFALEKGQTEKRQQAEQFVALLLSLSRNDLPIYVCLTMRSDFLGDCDAFYGLPEAINKSQFLVPRLTRSQRQDVITHPVNLAGAKISPRLVDKLLNENIDTRDDLPILQHALMRTWDDWQTKGGQGELDVRHYENIHTIHEALDRHADEALEELTTDKHKHIAKVLFQALTTVDEGNRRIRRPVNLDEVCSISSASPESVMHVIECFCKKNRSFLVLSSNGITGNPLIDISHESLIRQWKTLDKWVEEESEAAETYGRLVATSQRYKEGKADLLRHVELEQALTWQKQLPKCEAAEIWSKRYDEHFSEASEFLLLSETAHNQKLAEEKEAQEHQAKLLKEKAELEEQKRILAEEQAVEQKKSLTKTRWLSGIMALLTLIMLGVAWFAMQQSKELSAEKTKTEQALVETQRATIETQQALLESQINEKATQAAKELAQHNEKMAEKAQSIAKQKELEANYNLAKAFEEKSQFSISRGNVLTNKDPFSPKANSEYRNALLYALEAQKRQIPNNKTAILPASLSRISIIPETALESEVYRTPQLSITSLAAIAYSPSGKVIASGHDDNTIRLWSAQSGETISTLKGHTAPTSSIAYSSDGKVIASGSYDDTIRLWNAQTGETIKTLIGHTGSVNSITYSSDGKTIASGSSDNTVRFWDAQSGETIKTLKGHTSSVNSIAYSPDSKTIASGSFDNTIRLWNAQTGEIIKTLKGHSHWVNSIAYSPDGKIIASGSQDNTIRLWSAQSGEAIKTIKGHTSSISSVSYSPDGKVIAGSDDYAIRLWNAQSGQVIKTLTGHTIPIFSIAYSPDGKIIASGSHHGTIRLWNPQSSETIKTLKGHTNLVSSIAYSPNGKVIASGSFDDTIRLWNTQSGETIKTLKGHTNLVSSIAYSPNGKVIASGSSDNTIRLWNAQSGETIKILEGHSSTVSSIAYSPDGKVIASVQEDNFGFDGNAIQLWDAQSGETIKTLKRQTDPTYSSLVSSIAYSPDGKVIASRYQGNAVRLWNAQSGETIKTLRGHTGEVYSIAYSPDGKVIASASQDDTIRLWITQSGETINSLKGHTGEVYSITYSPSGKVIAAGSGNIIRLWNAQSGETINTLKGHASGVSSIAYSPNGKVIAAGTGNNIRLWQPDSISPVYRFVYDFDASEVSGALRFLWELELEDLNFKHTPRPQSWFPQLGHHFAWTDETRKFRPLLDIPEGDDSKMDQVIMWLEKRCAYKQPERYGCTPAKATEKSPN